MYNTNSETRQASFPLIRAEVIEDSKKEIARTEQLIRSSDRALAAYATEATLKALAAGKITKEEAENRAIARAAKKAEKSLANQLEKLGQIEDAKTLDYVSIVTTFARTGGVRAGVIVNGVSYTGHAAGYGYCKESTAAAAALNADFGALRVLCELKEASLAAGMSDVSKTACTGRDNRDVIGYGAGYTAIPYYEGGVGINCFLSIFCKAGYTVKADHSRKNQNFFTIYR